MLLASTRFASRTRTAPPPLQHRWRVLPYIERMADRTKLHICAISPLSSGRPTSPTRRTQRPSSGAAGTGASVGAATGAKRGTDTSLVCATVAHESVLKSTATHGEPGAVIARCSASLGQKNDCFVRCAVPRDGGEPVHRACRARVAHAAYRTGAGSGMVRRPIALAMPRTKNGFDRPRSRKATKARSAPPRLRSRRALAPG